MIYQGLRTFIFKRIYAKKYQLTFPVEIEALLQFFNTSLFHPIAGDDSLTMQKRAVTFSEPLITNMVTFPSIGEDQKPYLFYTKEEIDAYKVVHKLYKWNLARIQIKNMQVPSYPISSFLFKDEKKHLSNNTSEVMESPKCEFQGERKDSSDGKSSKLVCDACSSVKACSSTVLLNHQKLEEKIFSSPSRRNDSSRSERKITCTKSLSFTKVVTLQQMSNVCYSSSNKSITTAESTYCIKKGKNPQRGIQQDQTLRAAAA